MTLIDLLNPVNCAATHICVVVLILILGMLLGVVCLHKHEPVIGALFVLAFTVIAFTVSMWLSYPNSFYTFCKFFYPD
jgi:hypothetical protein